jgi:hypothetical protein
MSGTSSGEEEKPMPELSRRVFLSSGAGVAAAGVAIAAMPSVAAAVISPDAKADPAATIEELNAAGPLVVHIRDASAGEVSVMTGEQEVIFTDPAFIARVVAAANGRTN